MNRSLMEIKKWEISVNRREQIRVLEEELLESSSLWHAYGT